MIKLFAFVYLFSVCSKVWATLCVEPDTICVSDDMPETHMNQYLKGMVLKAQRVYKVKCLFIFGISFKQIRNVLSWFPSPERIQRRWFSLYSLKRSIPCSKLKSKMDSGSFISIKMSGISFSFDSTCDPSLSLDLHWSPHQLVSEATCLIIVKLPHLNS